VLFACCLSQELWETIADLRADGTDQDLLDALARGVGVHHSGLDTRYRQAVEMLIRSRHLQVNTAQPLFVASLRPLAQSAPLIVQGPAGHPAMQVLLMHDNNSAV